MIPWQNFFSVLVIDTFRKMNTCLKNKNMNISRISRYAFLILAILIGNTTDTNAQFLDKLKKKADQAEKVLNGKGSSLGKDQIANGLKEALDSGVSTAVETLSAKNGFLDSQYKILIPEEAQKVVSKVKHIPGFENAERDLILKMNEGAEIAAKKAAPIFKDAIFSMSFDDAMNILTGEDDAATGYLKSKSYEKLYKEFMPVIVSSLDEVNARDYWRSVVNAYNSLPLVKDVNPELDDHVNKSALNGMFSLIEKKEEGIRNNVDQRPTQLLKDVFAKQD